MISRGIATQTPHRPLAERSDLDRHLDSVHATVSQQLLASLMPAIEVAWADGVIQDHERELILAFAHERGLTEDAQAMQRIHRWLDTPPTNQECREAIEQLRELQDERGHAMLSDIYAQAEAVARADGGVFGFGSISRDERQALEWLDTALETHWDQSQVSPGRVSPMLGVLDVLRELIADRSAADTVHREVIPPGEHTLWPQPNPWGADGFAPAVLGVPQAEYREYMDVIVGRYMRSLKEGWWDAVCHAAMYPGVAPMSDAELGAMMHGAPFARFLCPQLDARDEASFGDRVAAARELGEVFKVDMRHLARCEPLPGIYLAPSVGLFALRDGVLTPVAIEVDGHRFCPGEGDAWELARCFFVQGCAVSMVLGAHPHLHFPMDAVIGMTREVVPPGHPLAQVIEAHAWLHLPLDYGVSFNERSVAHNHQREIYTPFPMRRDDVMTHIVSAFYVGSPDCSSRPGFRYPMAAPKFPGSYSDFLGRYYDVLLEFCRTVAAAIPNDDPVFASWAGPLHDMLPGFPSIAQLRDDETLARVICGFVHTVSVWHSADHHTFGGYPVNKIPHRLRVPPPTRGGVSQPQSKWMKAVDIVRQELARRLFYQAHTVRGILDVDYGFSDPGLIAAAQKLRGDLRRCDAEQPVRYIPLERIACSLQF